MKLWLQVLFAQGYLWRDRFPEALEPALERRGLTLLWLIFALVLPVLGVLRMLDGSWTVGVLFIVTGVGASLLNAVSVEVHRLRENLAFWTSLAWGAAVLIGPVISLIVVLAIQGDWGFATLLLLTWAFFGTAQLHDIESRYLFFSDPTANQYLLAGWPESFPRMWVETYWRLPIRIAQTMLGMEGSPSA